LNRKIEIRQDGQVRNVTVLEAIYLKQADDALKGNPRSAAFLTSQLRLADIGGPEADSVSVDDDDIVDRFLRENGLQATKKRNDDAGF
jgi:hypothetical protein